MNQKFKEICICPHACLHPVRQWAWPLLYRRDLFQQLNISVPNSWDDVIYLVRPGGGEAALLQYNTP
jgi:hypothetical protein